MSENQSPPSAPASRWPRRFAAAALVAAIPLVFFGGTVTTLHAGLAIDGWLVLEPGRGDHFLWLYPVDKWFRDVGTFVEHSHRLLGSLVGLLAIGAVVSTFATDRRAITRTLSVVALLAVIAQGVVGGLRVLEKSEDLAFLHGAIAQAVFAALGASALAASSAFAAGSRSPIDPAALGSLRARSTLAVVAVYLQIVVGAWLRHGGGVVALVVHGVLALFVALVLVLLARDLARVAKELEPAARARVSGLRSWILGLLVGQILLGIAAYVVVWALAGPDGKAPNALGTSVFPTMHVLTGGALLVVTLASRMWTSRLGLAPSEANGARGPSDARSDFAPRASLGGAR